MAPSTFFPPVAPGTPITQGFHPGHDGVDFGIPVGTVVTSSAPGTVTQAANTDPGGYGNEVDIDHGDGWATRYAHLSAFMVTAGAIVGAGDAIGASGGAAGAPGAGNSTGPHLHFEIRHAGVAVDPTLYMTGTATGRLTNLNIPFPGGGVSIPTPGGDVNIPGLNDAAKAVVGPLASLMAELPADTLKVLFAGHSPTELAIRLAELVGGAVLLTIGAVMLVRTIASGGEIGRTARSGIASAAVVGRGARRGARAAGTPARRPPARTSSTRRTSSRTSSTRTSSPPNPGRRALPSGAPPRARPAPSRATRPPRRGSPRAPEHYGAGDVELV